MLTSDIELRMKATCRIRGPYGAHSNVLLWLCVLVTLILSLFTTVANQLSSGDLICYMMSAVVWWSLQHTPKMGFQLPVLCNIDWGLASLPWHFCLLLVQFLTVKTVLLDGSLPPGDYVCHFCIAPLEKAVSIPKYTVKTLYYHSMPYVYNRLWGKACILLVQV